MKKIVDKNEKQNLTKKLNLSMDQINDDMQKLQDYGIDMGKIVMINPIKRAQLVQRLN